MHRFRIRLAEGVFVGLVAAKLASAAAEDSARVSPVAAGSGAIRPSHH